MKQRILACGLLLCCMFSMLTSCGKEAPLPEESAVSAASSGESAPEEANGEETQKMADQLLSAFFAGEFSAKWGDDAYEWISPELVQELREQVKSIGKPFLTEETVLQIAKAAGKFYIEAGESGKGILLPGYDAVESVRFSPSSEYTWYTEHEQRYNALLAYTLYLFTPPKYAFSNSEVGDLVYVEIQPRETALSCVYLALAGEYDTWRDALTALQEHRQGVILYVNGFVPGMNAPDFSYSWDPCTLLRPDWPYPSLELADSDEMAGTFFEALLAREVLANELGYFTYNYFPLGYYEHTPDGTVHVLLERDKAEEIRDLAEKVTKPILTEADVRDLLVYVYSRQEVGDVVLLPGVDGTGDVLTEPVGVDIRGVRLQVAAYLADLFTPPSYRFTDLTRIRGTYYALAGECSTPKEALDAFEDGEMFLLYTEDGDLYFTNGSLYTKQLMSSATYWQGG